jgi:hypothetical protein
VKIISADIASVSDYTAAGVILASGDSPRRYHLAALDRWREKYTVTVDKLANLARRHSDAIIVIDATGVGRPVLDSLRAALPARAVYGITITGGRAVNRGQSPGDVSVPKADIVGAVQVLLQNRRLTWPRELPLVRELQAEFAAFQMKTTPALHQIFGGVGSHDDLVLSLGLGVWIGEHMPEPIRNVEELVIGPFPDREPEDETRQRLVRVMDDLGMFDETV